MVKKRIPSGTFDNDFLKGTVRNYPSLECLTQYQRGDLDKRISHLIDFESNAKVPFQVVDYISRWISSKPDFEERTLSSDPERDRKRKYFFIDPWGGGSMAIVREGNNNGSNNSSISKGFNMIICHSDSPCLRLKPRPIKLEWDPEQRYNFLGVRLSAIAQGGLSVHQWLGQPVKIIGYKESRDGRKRLIEIPGFVPDTSAHIDYRGTEEVNEAFPPEKSLEIITGHTGQDETLKKFGFKSPDDFAQSKFFAVPINNPTPIDEYSWRLLAGYGHDDRSCIYSAVDAIIKTRDPKRTSIVLITDREEIGDNAPSGAQGPFFDRVLDYILEKEEHDNDMEFSEKDRRKVLYESCMLVGDVSIAPSGHDYEQMDVSNSPKLGFGVFIAADDSSSSNTRFIAQLKYLAERGLSRGYNLFHQISGNFYSQDKENTWFRDSDGKDSLYSRIGQWAWVGIPCASAHSPSEIICPADEFWTSKFYRRFLESDLSI